MSWIKKGLIFCPNKNFDWMHSHASLPTADHVKNNVYRIYFSTRNKENRSQVGFLETDFTKPKKILKLSSKPILRLGKTGSFDEDGVMCSSLVNHKSKKFMYYIGWNRSVSVPFRWAIGLAISEDNGETFTKFSDGPILDRNYIDPYFVSSPTVIYENGKWKMWYISSSCGWQKINNKKIAPYNIRYADSKNGIDWNRKGIISIDFKHKNEFAIGRASILKENGIYKMWYSYSTQYYRIGYAVSKDGIKWKRMDDKVGINVSKSGWDSQSIEHCHVFKHKSTKLMIYTGNDFGKTGFGHAEYSG
ncbi:hypothetical protein [Candidatus Nitrosotenuis uzonensis]|uniref:Glycosyl hydrolase family 32 N-terminal domain-containing protein n=1 Tax=Candidatus Nitrosotenuis uzonensis TaxID=1407055 RepID=V6AV76_9ARCH|nr:hypothetical protein [Candidatus Nitrosotenuis uzonensis]CDI06457.1 conserved hypothetical protein [Candidatus Nitrosotenuis uzonensis]